MLSAIVRLLGAALVVVPGSLVVHASPAPAAGATGAAPVSDALVREDLGFRLSAPLAGWRLLDAEQAAAVQPRAVAGAASAEGIWGIVVVEPAPDEPLVEVGRALVESTRLEDVEVERFEETEHSGRPAVHWTLSGRAQERAVRHDVTLVVAGGRLYRLVAWASGPEPGRDAPAAEAFAPFADAFALLAAEDATTPEGTRPGAVGVGWRVAGGTWQSSAHATRIAPAGGWRVVAGDELAELALETFPDAPAHRFTVGLVQDAARVRLLLSFDRVLEGDRAEWRRWTLAEAEERGSPRNESVLVPIEPTPGGETLEIELRLFDAPASDDGGAGMREMHGVLVGGERCVKLAGTYPVAFENDALASLHEGLAGLRFLDEPRRAELEREIAAALSGKSRVGDGFSLRSGVYRDFRFGLVWTRPDRGWDVAVGEVADSRVPGAALWLHRPSLDVRGFLRVRPVDPVPHAEWHRAAVSRATAGRAADRVRGVREVDLGAVRGLSSLVDARGGGPPTRELVVTAEHGGWAFELCLWGSPGVVAREADEVEAVLRALDVLEAPEPPTTTTDLAHYDDRLGFRLSSPDASWTFDSEGRERYWPAGTCARWSSPAGDVVGAVVLCGATADDGADLVASLARSVLPARLAEHVRGAPTKSATRLGERAAELLAWGEEERVEALVVDRERTLYVLVTAGAGAPRDRASREELFELLP